VLHYWSTALDNGNSVRALFVDYFKSVIRSSSPQHFSEQNDGISRSRTSTTMVVLFLPRCMECRRGIATGRLSVRLSIKRVDCDKREERSVHVYTP